MSNLMNFNYAGTIIQQRADGFINLTQMCNANGKRLDNWLRLKGTQAYLDTLATSLTSEGGNSRQMVVVDAGDNGSHSGTWGHPSVAINLARWLSDHFAVWCDAHIFNLMSTGQTSLDIDPLEEMRLKIELAKIEAQKETAIANAKQADLALVQFRHTITVTCPEVVQQKILGYQTIEKVEYRDRVIKNEDLIDDGSTVTKTELCRRYGLLTKKGSPNYKALNQYLEFSGLTHNNDAWQLSATIQENQQLKREFIPVLDQYFKQSAQRNLFLGE